MADIVAGIVTPGATADVRNGICGVAITAGDALRLNSATSRYDPAQADTAATAHVKGVALHDAVPGGPIAFANGGSVEMDAVLTLGTAYFLSSAGAGGIAPVADIGSGDTVTFLGIATATTVLEVKILNSATVLV